MYAIYRCDRHVPELVAICHTKWGANIAKKHFCSIWEHETCRPSVDLNLRTRKVMTYNTLRIGHAMLVLDRKRQHRKLRKLEEKEERAELASIHQREKVAALY